LLPPLWEPRPSTGSRATITSTQQKPLAPLPAGNFRLAENTVGRSLACIKKGGVMSERWHILHVGQHANLKNKNRTRRKNGSRRRPTMPSPEIPTEMLAFAERSLEQAKLAFDKFMDAAQSTMNTFEDQSKVAQAGAKEVTQKIKDFAEQNVTTTFDHAQKLVQAKDAQTLLTLHGEFVQSQMQVLTEQARVLGEISSKAAMDTAKPKS
jgi:phasin